jgi:hypothetical protein
MYDSVILSGHALRSLEDAWCEYARRNLLQVVRPLRVAAEIARAAARAAGVLNDDGVSDRSATSFFCGIDRWRLWLDCQLS